MASPATGSEVTARAVAFVAAHREPAERLGASLADSLNDPDGLALALRRGLATLADPEYLEGQRRIAPGIGAIHGVRWPLLAAVERGFRDATKGERPTPLLFIADRLFDERELEARWFAFGLLERTLAIETERTWQLLRRAAREAGDWITVDSLAHPYGKGIAAEPYRWAELELLVYSPSRWERRLVGSTIATMTHVDRKRGRDPDVARHALPLLASLMGDADPDVQKALAVGLSLADRRRPCRDRSRPARRDVPRRPDVRRPPRLGHPGHADQARPGGRGRVARPPRRDPKARGRTGHLDRGRDGGRLRAPPRSGNAPGATAAMTTSHRPARPPGRPPPDLTRQE